MALENQIRDTLLRLMNTGHRILLTATGGRIGTTFASMAAYTVTTTGRKSGQPRQVILTAPVQGDGTYVFVASKGGDDRHPEWYRNMVANPTFTIEPVDGGETISLVARTASVDEKAELWPQIVAAYKGYDRYQNSTDRDIPVIIAEPQPT